MQVDFDTNIQIKPFQWEDWQDLWLLREKQLLELGIVTNGEIPLKPDLDSPYETDFHRIGQIYLRDRGNFWIARINQVPVGHIGAEDRNEFVELRRMFVRKEFRRLGVGSKLVRVLIDHCQKKNVGMIRLWTSAEGQGRFLYQKFGFRETHVETDPIVHRKDEIRMSLKFS